MQPYESLENMIAGKLSYSPHDPVVVCSSGTAALHLALEALQLPQGSKVLVPDFTMVACARAVVLAGLEPVFVDCDARLCIDPEVVAYALKKESGIRAVMPVHIYGRRCQMDEIHVLASKYNLLVVEDMAEAHGVKPHQCTHAACWSFYRNKIVAGEEGGAVAFHELLGGAAQRARSLRSLGFTDDHDFWHTPRGHNYRLANSLASLVIPSLDSLSNNLINRRYAEEVYDHYCPREWQMPYRDVVWVYDFRLPDVSESLYSKILDSLVNRCGVPARMAFKPMHLQPEFNQCSWYGFNGISVISSREVLYVPVDKDYRHTFEHVYRMLP